MIAKPCQVCSPTHPIHPRPVSQPASFESEAYVLTSASPEGLLPTREGAVCSCAASERLLIRHRQYSPDEPIQLVTAPLTSGPGLTPEAADAANVLANQVLDSRYALSPSAYSRNWIRRPDSETRNLDSETRIRKLHLELFRIGLGWLGMLRSGFGEVWDRVERGLGWVGVVWGVGWFGVV